MEVEEEKPGPPRGLFLALGLIGLVLGAALAGEFALALQPQLGGNVTAGKGTVLMPPGVGANTKLTFDPPVVVIVLGVNSSLTFDNTDTVTHTVTATNSAFNSGDIKAGTSWTYDFGSLSPGNYSFYCIYHSWMKATLVVLAAH